MGRWNVVDRLYYELQIPCLTPLWWLWYNQGVPRSLIDTAGRISQPWSTFWGHVNMLICSGWKSNKTCGLFLHQSLVKHGSASVFEPSRQCVTAASLCVASLFCHHFLCVGMVRNNPTAVWVERGESAHLAWVSPAPFGCKHICKRTNTKIHVDVNTCTHRHSGLPLPRLIYEGHKDIIASVMYGGSEVPHAERRCRLLPSVLHIVLERLRGTPEPFSIWCQHRRWGGGRGYAPGHERLSC